MKCPNCIAVDLLMSERKGIEIDYCPSCRGVWLDRGELDKFIQQTDQQNQSLPSGRFAPVQPSPAEGASQYERNDSDERKYRDRSYEVRESHGDDRRYYGNGKKKESFWSELFDFD